MELIKKETDCAEFEAGDATILKEILHPSNDPVPINFSLAQARIRAGGASLVHRLSSSETYYFLGGKGMIYIDERAYEVSQGSIVFVPANASQYVKNTGKTDLSFLCIVEPFWSESGEIVD